MEKDVLVVDGVKYFREGSIKILPKVSDKYFLVRTYSAGVFFGQIKSRKGQEIKMINARRIWYWDGAASLSQLAYSGTTKPENCKFPVALPEIELLQVIEIIPCTEKAILSINGVPIWEK
jgi:hypothetical protein